MNLLVTGARGFVGQGLLAFLNGCGIGSFATGRSAPDSSPKLRR
jgi:dTDP-4-dehydrorhamnose reductase